MFFNTNVPLEVVEKRCKPQKLNTVEEAEFTSHTGFLGPGDRILSVIERDAAVLAALGTTSTDLSARLRAFLAHCEASLSRGSCGTVSWDGSTYTVQWNFFLGSQWWPWVSKRESDDFNRSERLEDVPEHLRGWSDEFLVYHNALGLLARVGGGSDRGAVAAMAAYGFFEGGDQNPYRIDPELLNAMMTGKGGRKCAERAVRGWLKWCEAEIVAEMAPEKGENAYGALRRKQLRECREELWRLERLGRMPEIEQFEIWERRGYFGLE